MTLARLVTIPPSHYCDKARWALDHAGIAYREEGHAPILHYPFVYPRTRTRTVPVLFVEGRAPIVDSTDIVRYADAALPEDRRLFPSATELGAEVADWVRRFDDTLGPAVRRHVYCYLVHDPRAFVDIFVEKLGATERAIVVRAQRVLRAMLARAFRVSPRAAARTRAEVEAVFALVGDALADGRAHLVGDRFTAADLTFAALASPLLTPPGGDVRLPPELLETVTALRATPAGAYGLRLLEARR